jgi:hypothetical protein
MPLRRWIKNESRHDSKIVESNRLIELINNYNIFIYIYILLNHPF